MDDRDHNSQLALLTIAAVLVTTGFILSELDYRKAIVAYGLSLVALSHAHAIETDGLNRALWDKFYGMIE